MIKLYWENSHGTVGRLPAERPSNHPSIDGRVSGPVFSTHKS